MYSLIIPWLLTVIIEFVIIWLFIRKEPEKLLFYSFLVNSITLPLATYGYNYIYPNLILIEALVFLGETLLLKLMLEIDYSKAILISLVANITTAMLGYFM